MTQEERWLQQYNKLMDFMTTNQRRPSKHRIEEHLMLNWLRHNQKLMAKGELPPERQERFAHLMSIANKFRRLNQYG